MYQLIAKWTILPGKETEAVAALKKLAVQVKEEEPDTLIYLVNTPDFAQTNLPIPYAGTVTFFEGYKNKDAFLAHLNGPAFTGFVKAHGDLFLQSNGQAFVIVETLKHQAGFIRSTEV